MLPRARCRGAVASRVSHKCSSMGISMETCDTCGYLSAFMCKQWRRSQRPVRLARQRDQQSQKLQEQRGFQMCYDVLSVGLLNAS